MNIDIDNIDEELECENCRNYPDGFDEWIEVQSNLDGNAVCPYCGKILYYE